MHKAKEYVRLFRRSFSELGENRRLYMGGVVLGAFELVLSFATPYASQRLIDAITANDFSGVVRALLWMTLFFVVLAPAVVAGKYFQASAVAKGTASLRERMLLHIVKLPYSVLKTYESGDYIVRLTDDANKALQIFNSFRINSLIRFVVVFPASFVLLLIHDWHIAIAGVLYGAAHLIISFWLNPLTKKLEGEAKEQLVESTSFFLETLRGMPVIRAFCLQGDFAGRFSKICDLVRAKRTRFSTVKGIAYGFADLFCQSAQAAAFLLGVLLSAQSPDIGQIVFNASLMSMMEDAVFCLSNYLLNLQANLVSVERVLAILDEPEEDLTASSQPIAAKGTVAVEMRNVSFSYDGVNPVVRNLDLQIKSGEHVAIVGGSGGGKSTVLKLIEAFFPPDSGKIFYYGEPGVSHSLCDIRSLMAYVPQDCPLFEGTMAQNIAMGNPDASREEMEQAVVLAGLADFSDGGLDMLVGEQGGQLSGGQRQRVAIARAFVKKAPILLLDEFTSALDAATEEEILSSLDSVWEGLTTVTVAHRLSTVRNTDRILVMERGAIREEGNFSELLEKHGLFYRLYQKQVVADSAESANGHS